MTALATLDDVAAVSRVVPDSDVTQVERLLEMVSASVRRHTGQTFDLVADDEITIYPLDGEVVLPQRPVVSIASVSEWGTGTLAPSSYEFLPSGRLYRVYQSTRQSWRRGKLTVTYTHGFAEIPDDIAMVVAEVAAERWNATATNPKGVQRTTTTDVGGYTDSITFRQPSSALSAWSPEHLEILDSYGLPKVGSLRLRS